MNASRGRLGVYNILHSEEALRDHLFETDLLSQNSLFTYLKKYTSVEIRPSFGPGAITIQREKNTFSVHSLSYIFKELSKEEMYEYLKSNTIDQKYYIIQPKKLSAFYFQSPFQYYVTIHRKSAVSDWRYISKTEKYRSLFGSFFNLYFLRKIEHLSLLTARKLGKYFPDCHTFVIEIIYDLKGKVWIRDVIFHYSISKWNQHNVLSMIPTLNPLIPTTEILTRATFYDFLKEFKQVILKPCNGQEGKGIVKVTYNNHLFEIHSGRNKLMKDSIEETYDYLQHHFFQYKYYLIQEKLSLATINECPFDVRVITQKIDSEWKITGKIVKVAAIDYFITNAASMLLPLNEAIDESNISHMPSCETEKKIDEICISASQHLEINNKGISIIGFDIGITDQGKILIIEGNFVPDLSMFYRLEDKTMYRNIYKNKQK